MLWSLVNKVKPFLFFANPLKFSRRAYFATLALLLFLPCKCLQFALMLMLLQSTYFSYDLISAKILIGTYSLDFSRLSFLALSCLHIEILTRTLLSLIYHLAYLCENKVLANKRYFTVLMTLLIRYFLFF